MPSRPTAGWSSPDDTPVASEWTDAALIQTHPAHPLPAARDHHHPCATPPPRPAPGQPSAGRGARGLILRLARALANGSLRPADVWFLTRVTALTVCLPALLRLLSLPRLLRLLDPGHPAATATAFGPLRHQVRLVHGLLGRDRGIFRHSCLRRSLVLFRFLRRAGYPVTVVFGISRSDHTLDGHAWVELDRRPVAEPPGKVERFHAIYRFPAPGDAR